MFQQLKQRFIAKCGVFVRHCAIDKSDSESKCYYCGVSKSEHQLRWHCEDTELVSNDPLVHSKWTQVSSIGEETTGAYGRIRFTGPSARRDEAAHYVRLSSESDCSIALGVLLNDWKVPEPSIVISVTGGSSDFRFDQKLKDSFSAGLVKMARSSGAWIVTGGEHSGVMKLSGLALCNCLSGSGGVPVPCIGICTWGRQHGSETLEKSNETVEYNSVPKPLQSNTTALDPNHSHFLLVDDGTKRRERTHQKFHGRLNEEIMKHDFRHGMKVPIVTVLVNGGTGSLDTVRESLRQRVPVVVVKGSGRCADVLAFASDCAKREMQANGKYQVSWTTEDHLELELKIKDVFTRRDMTTRSEKDEQVFNVDVVATMVKDVEKMVTTGLENKKSPLLSVYDALDQSQSPSLRELDYLVLVMVFRLLHEKCAGETDHSNTSKILRDAVKLAIDWNRTDIVRDEFLSVAFNIQRVTSNDWDNLLEHAVRTERREFVRLFVDEGVVDINRSMGEMPLQDFLKPRSKSDVATNTIPTSAFQGGQPTGTKVLSQSDLQAGASGDERCGLSEDLRSVSEPSARKITRLEKELDMEAEVTDKQIWELSKAVGEKWMDIGFYLGLKFEELKELEHVYRENSRRLLEVLRKWKGNEEGIASVGALMNACRQADVAGSAKKVLQHD